MTETKVETVTTPGEFVPDEVEKAQLDFLWKQHSYVADFIKFADAKCGFIVSADIAYTAILLSSTSRFRMLLPENLHGLNSFSHTASSLVLLSLLCSAGCAAWTVYPRLRIGPKVGPISWIEIASFTTSEIFVQRAESIFPSQAVRLMAEQIYYMSHICKRKHMLIRYSIALTVAAVCISLSLFIKL